MRKASRCAPRLPRRPFRPIKWVIINDLWYEAFLKDEDITFEESLAQVVALAAPPDYETALLAEVGGVPAGLCLFVREELEPRHDLTPWLASLYVVPEFRGRSIGGNLVAAIEDHARQVGCARLHLYTTTAEGFYARLGWQVAEHFLWDGTPFVLMQRDL